MATIKRIVGSRSETIANAALASLGVDTYAVSSAGIDCQTADPLDALIDATITTGASTSNDKCLLVFAKVSSDGTNYTSGPEGSSSATDEANLYLVGVVPTASSGTAYRGVFSLYQALGFMPTHFKIVVRNRTGATLAASTHSVGYALVTGDVA
jgi:hypothetical protein